MHYKITFLAVLCALFGFTPVMADEPGAPLETEDGDIIPTDQYDVIRTMIEELNWCPDDGSMPSNADKAELCKLIQENDNLSAELSSNTEALEDNAKAMKDKENSFENRMLGGLAMGTVGIGGMMAASGLAEQSADEDAERDMRAYLATFQCKVGDKRYSGGTTGIETPGANQLIKLYQEYAELAADVKERKTALGMKPGIESEIVIDKSSSGLYDDVGGGIGSGAYASIARALQNPGGEDAARWAEQKDAASSKLKTGALVAGAGVVASLAANYAVNHNNKDKSQDLLAQREQIKTKFNDLSDKIVKDCNATIQRHKDFVKQLSAEQLQDETVANYKQYVDDAQPITDISELKDNKLCR